MYKELSLKIYLFYNNHSASKWCISILTSSVYHQLQGTRHWNTPVEFYASHEFTHKLLLPHYTLNYINFRFWKKQYYEIQFLRRYMFEDGAIGITSPIRIGTQCVDENQVLLFPIISNGTDSKKCFFYLHHTITIPSLMCSKYYGRSSILQVLTVVSKDTRGSR